MPNTSPFIISFTEFQKYLSHIQDFHSLQEQVDIAMRHYNHSDVERIGSIDLPSLETEVISLLKTITGDKDDWIGYWVYELNCGKEWHPGMITEKDGTDIPLKTVEDLWNLLVCNSNSSEKERTGK